MALFCQKVFSPCPWVLFFGAVARKLAPVSLCLLCRMVLGYLEMGGKGGCRARLGGHAEQGVVPQLPRPVLLGAARCCTSTVPVLMAWILGLLQKHLSVLTVALL